MNLFNAFSNQDDHDNADYKEQVVACRWREEGGEDDDFFMAQHYITLGTLLQVSDKETTNLESRKLT